jgi:hypothetical protein
MAAYAVIARIDQVKPHLAGRAAASRDAWPMVECADPPEAVDLVNDGSDLRLAERWMSLRETWSQTTFYLFNADGWR